MNSSPDTIRVLVTDDHLIVREGLALILETADGMEIVGEATDGAAALRLCHELRPDVVLMDLRMPGMDGLTAIGLLQQQLPEIAVIILTTYDEDDMMVRGLQAGARGFLLKDTDRATLLDAIRAAARGQTSAVTGDHAAGAGPYRVVARSGCAVWSVGSDRSRDGGSPRCG